MFSLDQEISVSEYTAARQWAVAHGYTITQEGEKRYKISLPSSPTSEEKAAYVRAYRNALLKESDWTQLSDNALSETQKEKWAQYRQSLRDISLQGNFPDVEWPVLSYDDEKVQNAESI